MKQGRAERDAKRRLLQESLPKARAHTHAHERGRPAAACVEGTSPRFNPAASIEVSLYVGLHLRPLGLFLTHSAASDRRLAA